MNARTAALACLLAVAACGGKAVRQQRGGPMEPPAYWVWHRGSPLTVAEKESLRANKLYWQAAECGWKHGTWSLTRISAPFRDASIIPVFRIHPETAFLGSPAAAGTLAAAIRGWSEGAELREIQLDFDCPDRLLDRYATFLESLGREIAPCRISITALAGWPRHPQFAKLTAAVSSLAPMFYDLEPDAAQDVRDRRFQPMADAEVARLIALWSTCEKPWLAGLPNFERLSVFDHQGALIGHLRGWRHDEVFFHPDLKARSLGGGVTLFDISKAVDLAGTRVPRDGITVHRMPEAGALSAMVDAADRAGARGILYFALPGPGLQAAYSPAHLAATGDPRPRLSISRSGAVILENPGPRDLAAGVWELEVGAGHVGSFRSASPAGFATAEGAGGLPPELATSLILRFSKLPAGASLDSGPLVGNPDGLRWSLRGIVEDQAVDRVDSAR